MMFAQPVNTQACHASPVIAGSLLLCVVVRRAIAGMSSGKTSSTSNRRRLTTASARAMVVCGAVEMRSARQAANSRRAAQIASPSRVFGPSATIYAALSREAAPVRCEPARQSSATPTRPTPRIGTRDASPGEKRPGAPRAYHITPIRVMARGLTETALKPGRRGRRARRAGQELIQS